MPLVISQCYFMFLKLFYGFLLVKYYSAYMGSGLYYSIAGVPVLNNTIPEIM